MSIELKSRHLWEWVAENSADPGDLDDPVRAWRATAKLMLEDLRTLETIHNKDLITYIDLTGALEEAHDERDQLQARITELEAELERVAQGAADVAWERLKLERQLAEAKRWQPVEDGRYYLTLIVERDGYIIRQNLSNIVLPNNYIRLCRQVDSVPASQGDGQGAHSQEGGQS